MHGTTRREFLKRTAALAAAGYGFFPGGAAVAQDAKAREKNDRPLIGAIGCGGQGTSIAGSAKRFGDIVAVCDVDATHAERANAKLADGKAEVFGDYRKLLERDDVDAVTIGTPDHWHAKIAIEAMQSGKDVYCEKPLTLTIEEGRLICKAVKETGRVFQVGTQQRSHGPFAQAVALCREGRLGEIRRILVAIGGAPKGGPFQKEPPASHLDWDFWQGQTPAVEYIRQRCHHDFRWWFEYSGGKMTDWGAHHVDIAHWALGADDTGPVSFEGMAEFPVPLEKGHPTADDQFNTATTFRVLTKFGDGVELVIADHIREDDGTDFENGVQIEGTQGRIFVNRGRISGKPVEELTGKPLPEDAIARVYKGKKHGDHMGNFFECIKTREQPVSDVFSHHRAITTCHLANICLRLGRPLRWDPKTEEIVGDEEANRWQSREQRKGYEIAL
ncbi:MAG: Gfo/Idh/MocA family oxidoreductase [Planctomycetes bacterium]|nr:Gfo/Idh/MocA family oxidoreductase [Planctomycetota bacterium]